MGTRSEELIAKITALAEKLGKTGVTTVTGLDEAQLGILADTLQGEVDAADRAAADLTTAAKKGARSSGEQYAVAAGASLTAGRRIIDAGEDIAAKDLAGGLEALEGFVKTGHIVRKA